MNVRMRALRVKAVAVGMALATTATASACRGDKPPIDAAAGREYVAALYKGRAESEATSGRPLYRTIDEVLPNVKFQMPSGEQLSAADYALVGRIVEVRKGRGFRVDATHVDGTPTDFGDSHAMWRTAHAVIEVERAVGLSPVPAERFLLYLPAGKADDFPKLAAGLKGLGQVVVFADRRNVLTTYDDSLYAPIDEAGIVLAAVGPDGSLSLPLMPSYRSDALLATKPTLQQLEEAGRVPRVIPVVGTEPNVKRADGL